MYYQQLKDKIENRTAVLGVLGLGYVGLPLAVEKDKGKGNFPCLSSKLFIISDIQRKIN